MRLMLVDLSRGAGLHDAAGLHDLDPVAHGPHHRQVVGDEQVGHSGLILDVLEQVQDQGLN
jgi:hypothetical protein